MTNDDEPSTPTFTSERIRDEALGALLNHHRTRLGMSIPHLVTLTGFDAQELIDHEAGTLPVPAVRLPILARALGTTSEALLHQLPDCPNRCRSC
ncbi:MAG: hypothetical protein AAGI30_11560 [Planctomycetota bacterium]